MKRLLAFLLTLMFALGCMTAIAQQDAMTLHFMFPYAEDHAISRSIAATVKKYQEEVNPNLVYQPEYISDSEAYYQKLKILIASNEAPDMFWGDPDTFTLSLRDQGMLYNMGALLEELGLTDKFMEITYAYPKYKDGSLYLMATGANTEYFFYHPSLFEKAGIEKVPETWDEFFEVCEKLKAAGVTPIASMGAPWYLLRWASFIPYRMTGNQFITDAISGNVSWGSEPGIAMGEFMQKVSQYFVDGWAGLDASSSRDYFLSGGAAMWYMTISSAQDVVTDENRELKEDIAYFKLPMLEGYDATTEKDYFANSGKGIMLLQETMDAHEETMKEFIRFFVENFGDIAVYDYAYLSGIKPENMDNLSEYQKQMYANFAEVGVDKYAHCWDVVIDAASNEVLKAEIVNLTLGEITPEEFAKRMDAAIAENVLE